MTAQEVEAAPATREEILDLAGAYQDAADAGEGGTTIVKDEYALIAAALRAYADAREAKPVAIIGTAMLEALAERERIDICLYRPGAMHDIERVTPVFLAPPTYAAGYAAGLEAAADVAWVQSKQGATHDQIKAAILALKDAP